MTEDERQYAEEEQPAKWIVLVLATVLFAIIFGLTAFGLTFSNFYTIVAGAAAAVVAAVAGLMPALFSVIERQISLRQILTVLLTAISLASAFVGLLYFLQLNQPTQVSIPWPLAPIEPGDVMTVNLAAPQGASKLEFDVELSDANPSSGGCQNASVQFKIDDGQPSQWYTTGARAILEFPPASRPIDLCAYLSNTQGCRMFLVTDSAQFTR